MARKLGENMGLPFWTNLSLCSVLAFFFWPLFLFSFFSLKLSPVQPLMASSSSFSSLPFLCSSSSFLFILGFFFHPFIFPHLFWFLLLFFFFYLIQSLARYEPSESYFSLILYLISSNLMWVDIGAERGLDYFWVLIVNLLLFFI